MRDEHQRRLAIRIGRIRIRTGFQQVLDDGHIPIDGRFQQGTGAELVDASDVGVRFEKAFD